MNGFKPDESIMPPPPFYCPLGWPSIHRSPAVFSSFCFLSWFPKRLLVQIQKGITSRDCRGARKFFILQLQMAPRGQLVKGKARADPEQAASAVNHHRRKTRAQLQAQEEAEIFKDNIPLKIRREVEAIAEDLWTSVRSMPKDELRREVADWVLDPGSTAGRAAAYDRLLMQYWVNMKLVGHSFMEREAKSTGDEEPVRAWKLHNGECHLIHQKIDILASRLGVSFYAAGKAPGERARPRACCDQCGKKKRRASSPAAEPTPSGASPVPAQALRSGFPSAFQKFD